MEVRMGGRSLGGEGIRRGGRRHWKGLRKAETRRVKNV